MNTEHRLSVMEGKLDTLLTTVQTYLDREQTECLTDRTKLSNRVSSLETSRSWLIGGGSAIAAALTFLVTILNIK